MTRLSKSQFPKSRRCNPGLVLFRKATSGRTHEYGKTYAKRIYYVGQRKFVIWDGMVCWLRRAYRGHYVVWTMQSPELLLAA